MKSLSWRWAASASSVSCSTYSSSMYSASSRNNSGYYEIKKYMRHFFLYTYLQYVLNINFTNFVGRLSFNDFDIYSDTCLFWPIRWIPNNLHASPGLELYRRSGAVFSLWSSVLSVSLPQDDNRYTENALIGFISKIERRWWPFLGFLELPLCRIEKMLYLTN